MYTDCQEAMPAAQTTRNDDAIKFAYTNISKKMFISRKETHKMEHDPAYSDTGIGTSSETLSTASSSRSSRSSSTAAAEWTALEGLHGQTVGNKLVDTLHGARFSTGIYTRGFVWPMPFLSGVPTPLTGWHCKLHPHIEGTQPSQGLQRCDGPACTVLILCIMDSIANPRLCHARLM
jgi:hypothetical protein